MKYGVSIIMISDILINYKSLDMITVLTWISIISGGLLILLLLLSLFSGLDFDFDVESPEMDSDAGGLGIFKGMLTFVSVSSWVIKVLLVTDKHPIIAISIGILLGLLALALLSYLIRILLRNDKNVNWDIEDALFAFGTVYLKIPGEDGIGLVNVDVKGATREMKAKSHDGQEIPTGDAIQVIRVDGDIVIVQKEDHKH